MASVAHAVQTARRHMRPLPLETRLSFPIPAWRGADLVLFFFLCPQGVMPGKGAQIASPTYTATIDPTSGRFLEMKEADLADQVPGHEEGQVLGTFVLPPGMDAKAYLVQEHRLLERYDAVLSLYRSRQTRLSADQRAAVREFHELWNLLSEPPLAPYYQAAGKDFFDWLDNARK